MSKSSSESASLLHRNSAFTVLAALTVVILSVPLVAMQITDTVNWGLFDFIIMAALIFGVGSVFILLARSFPAEHRLLLFVVCALLFLYLWAELAVGIFTDLGS